MNKKVQPIRLHPHWKQFIATEGLIIPIPIALIFIAGYDEFPIPQFISRKTKCSTFAKHFVPKSHLLTQFKM